MANARIEAAAHGKLLPTIVDEVARDEPDALWAEHPVSATSFDTGFSKITYSQFANAVNAIAFYITNALGRRDTGEPIAWLAPNDPRCSLAIVAAMKAGFKLFLISERNSVAANHKLFDDVGCLTLLTTSRDFAPVRETIADRKMMVIELLSLDTLLEQTDLPAIHYIKTMETYSKETAFMVHTSGSTGFPKPMSISHELVSKIAQNIGLRAPEGYDMQSALIGGNRCALLLPLGHPAGVNFGLLNAFFNRTTVILPLPHVPPTGEALVRILHHTKADWAALAPLTLESISKDASLLDTIASHLKLLVFSGGSLPKVFGDVIAEKIQLVSSLGSSETGPLSTMYHHGYNFRNDWNYLQFHPKLGAVFDPLPGGVYELVFKRTPETEPYQGVFSNYPHLTEFRTKDLFTKHPVFPDLWTHASRSDDVIVFINGEKVNPVDFESHVSQHPEVSAALMFGNQRFEAGLLIELNTKTQFTTAEKAQMVQRLWPTIERANSTLPSYAKISQGHICFTDPDKPVLRTLKGTIRRQVTLEMYQQKLNQLYADVETAWTNVGRSRKLDSESSVVEFVRESIRKATKIAEIEDNEDFFQRGMDSLGVLRLVRQLRLSFGIVSIQPTTVYLNPSVAALSRGIYQLAHASEQSKSKDKQQRVELLHTIMTKKFNEVELIALKMSEGQRNRPTHTQKDQVVILTGSTGSIGSYILRALLQRGDVKHIYCVNRSSDSLDVQKERNAKLDPTLPVTFAEDKVTFLTGDLTRSADFGLEETVLKELLDNVTLVIHNAWTVDFNLPLQYFEPHLTGVLNLASFCASSTRQASLLFNSSISAVMNYHTVKPTSPVPEEIITDVQTAADTGYSQSKYVAERVIAYATEKFGLRNTTILRLGQIAGAAQSPGKWNPSDWIPAMIRSSKYLGVIPDAIDNEADGITPTIDWLPIDTAGEISSEIGLEAASAESDESNTRVLHLLNLRRTWWKALLPAVVSALESLPGPEESKCIEIVSPGTWLAKLRNSTTASLESAADEQARETLLKDNPALRLVDFFQMRFGTADTLESEGVGGRPEWETAKAEEASERLRGVEEISGEVMGKWVRGWFEEV